MNSLLTTVYVKYSTEIPRKHNKTKLSQTNTSDENTCNCRNKKRCPMNGKCLVKSLVYQATVTTVDNNRPSQTYVGLTENTFKTRFNNHKASFNSYQKKTLLNLANMFGT